MSYCLLALVVVAAPQGGTSWIWLVLLFALFTLAELYILPVGLGLFATLAPRRFGASARIIEQVPHTLVRFLVVCVAE